jgi:hypothetical protein
MKQKIILLTALLCFAALTASCAGSAESRLNADISGSSTVQPQMGAASEITEIKVTFPEAVAFSNFAAVAEFIGYDDSPSVIRYRFSVKETLRGEVPEKTIHLLAEKGVSHLPETGHSYEPGRKDRYTIGEEYVLILQRMDSIFNDHPNSVLVTDILIPANDVKSGTMYGELITDQFDGDILKLLRETELPESQDIPYILSDDMPTLVAETEYIIKIKIDYTSMDTDFKAGSFYCYPLEVLKGSGRVDTMPEGHIVVSLLKEHIKPGETYIVLVNRAGDNSFVYVQSSLTKGIFNISDVKAIDEIRALIH